MELTEKEQEARKKVCLALDVPTVKEGLSLVSELSDLVGTFKINSLFNVAQHEAVNPWDMSTDLVKEIKNKGAETFLDLKYHDTPNTVFNYAVASAQPGVYVFDVHIAGGEEMCKKALEGAYEGALTQDIERPKVIGITVLTSLDNEDLQKQGLNTTYKELVMRRTELAKKWGLDGVVCAANIAGEMERNFGSDFLYVTPGIKWAGKQGTGQKQLYTPDMAVRDCSNSILVIGSAIRKAENRRKTAYEILQAMAGEL